MKDSDFIDLANRVVDGVGTEHDQSALEAVIQSSMMRRIEYDQLAAVASILDAVRPVEPPPALRNRILASLPLTMAPKESRASSLWRSLADTIRARPQVSIAYAVIAGLVVGVIGLGAVTGSLRTDDSNVFGTISAYQSGGELAVVDQAAVQDEGLTASLSLNTSPKAFRVDVAIESDVSVDVELTSAPGTKWVGVLRLDGAPEMDLALGDQKVAATGLSHGMYSFVGSMQTEVNSGATVEVSFRREGRAESRSAVRFP